MKLGLSAFRNKNFFVLFSLIIITSFVYFSSLYNEFCWDDFFVVVSNDFVKSFKNLPELFSAKYLTPPSEQTMVTTYDVGSGEATYRPIVTATYFLDYFLWKLNAWGYHFTNLILHLLNVILVYFLVCALNLGRKTSFVTALLFALHPVNVEPVCNISFREDLLVFFFYMSSLLLLIKSNRRIPTLSIC